MGCCALLQGIFLTQGQIHVSYISCIGRGFFTTSATWEGQSKAHSVSKPKLADANPAQVQPGLMHPFVLCPQGH